jgi:hypothetical protein
MSDQMHNSPETARAQCRQFDLNLSAYLEGDGHPEVARHAEECPFCSAILADLQLIQSKSHEVLREDPPASVWAKIHASIKSARAQCLQFDLNLPAYLEDGGHPEVLTHAQQCASCSGILADLQLIQSQSREAILEDPPARVWANVRATLDAEGVFREPSPGWFGWPGWSAWFPKTGPLRYATPFAAFALLVLFGATLLVPPTSVGPKMVSNLSSEPFIEASFAAPAELDKMETAYRDRAKSFDPAVQASYQKGLESLDNSIQECQESVRKEPGNTLAREYLATAYQQKAAVLSAALEYDGR